MITDDPLPKRAVIVAGLMIVTTLIYSWLGTEWKYEHRKTETPSEIIGYSAGYCGFNSRGMDGLPDPRIDNRTKAIERFLDKYNPDMHWIAPIVVSFSDYYRTDPYLVVAIGSLEQDYFRSCYYNNCWGHRYNGRYLTYESMAEGIEAAARLLGKERYRGKTIDAIGRIYAEDPNWPAKVTTIYGKVKYYE